MEKELQRSKAVILTALGVEYQAVRAYLSNLQEEVHSKGTVYEHGTFDTGSHLWEVIIAEIGAGNAGAAFEAERAIAYFNPDIIFFVGVAGGIKDVKIGDVVVATKVYGYESAKLKDGMVLSRPSVGESDYALIQRALAERRKQDWLQRTQHCDRSLNPQPDVFVGAIAAGEKVVADIRSDVYQFLYQYYNDTLAVEMEGKGILLAAHANAPVKALIVRGISDLIENKSEADKRGSQKLAACYASAFALEVLAKLDVPTLSATYQSIGQQNAPVSRGEKNTPLEIFFSYDKKDEALVEQLKDHLAVLTQNKLITNWYAKNIVPGQKPDEETMKHLNTAHIILLLVSASFIASERQSIEVQQAMQRSEAQKAIVIPILLRPTALLHDASFGKLQAIPRSGRPVTLWTNHDAALAQVAEEIGEVVKSLKKKGDNKR